MTAVTRRFFCRPSSVSLLATGLDSPRPWVLTAETSIEKVVGIRLLDEQQAES